jgi:diguanylate cyclase (GGDEF)-like protein
MKESKSSELWLKCLLGAFGTLAACALLYIFHIPNADDILLTLVVPIAFFGGFTAGVPSGLVVILYAVFAFSEPNQPLHYTQTSTVKVLVVASCTAVLVILLGILKMHCERIRENLLKSEKEVETLKVQDPLTGLPNRSALERVLHQESDAAAHTEFPLSFALIDLDYFKQYNNANGRTAGDNCLKRVAEAINKEIQGAGFFAARFGGEEFAVVMPNTDTGEAQALCRKIKDSIEALQIPHSGSAASSVVTVSIGIATAAPKRRVVENSFVCEADKALSCAKDNGRNRVEIYSESSAPAAKS